MCCFTTLYWFCDKMWLDTLCLPVICFVSNSTVNSRTIDRHFCSMFSSALYSVVTHSGNNTAQPGFPLQYFETCVSPSSLRLNRSKTVLLWQPLREEAPKGTRPYVFSLKTSLSWLHEMFPLDFLPYIFSYTSLSKTIPNGLVTCFFPFLVCFLKSDNFTWLDAPAMALSANDSISRARAAAADANPPALCFYWTETSTLKLYWQFL